METRKTGHQKLCCAELCLVPTPKIHPGSPMSFAAGNNPVSARRIESRSSKISWPSNLRLPEANILRIACGHGVEGEQAYLVAVTSSASRECVTNLRSHHFRSTHPMPQLPSQSLNLMRRFLDPLEPPKAWRFPELIRQKKGS